MSLTSFLSILPLLLPITLLPYPSSPYSDFPLTPVCPSFLASHLTFLSSYHSSLLPCLHNIVLHSFPSFCFPPLLLLSPSCLPSHLIFVSSVFPLCCLCFFCFLIFLFFYFFPSYRSSSLPFPFVPFVVSFPLPSLPACSTATTVKYRLKRHIQLKINMPSKATTEDYPHPSFFTFHSHSLHLLLCRNTHTHTQFPSCFSSFKLVETHDQSDQNTVTITTPLHLIYAHTLHSFPPACSYQAHTQESHIHIVCVTHTHTQRKASWF